MEAREKVCLLGFCFLLASCGSPAETATDKVTELALAAIGVKSTDKAEAPRWLTLYVEAAKDLNAGGDGQGLPTVAKVYKLRDHAAFMAAPYTHFSTPEKERLAFGGDVIEVKELTLLPGKTMEIKEKMPSDAPYLGVVALFRNPAANRWRFTFTAPPSGGPVIKVGAHTCALTATTLAPVGMTLNESALLSATQCR